jgi:hypothetical protein
LVKAFGYVKDAIGDNLETFKTFGSFISTYLAPVIGTVLGGALQIAGKIAGGVIDVIGKVVGALNFLISGAIAGINALISAYNFANNIFGGKDISKINAPTLSVPKVITPGISTSVPKIPTIPTPSIGGGGGGGGGGGVAAAVMSAGVAAAASGGGFTDSQNAARLAAMGGGGFTDSQNAARISITVNGAIDKEGTARTIVETLNSSYYRGTGGATALVAI